MDFATLRIDDNGVLLCSKKDEGVFVSWEKIRYVIFVLNDYGSKIIVRQYNKETHELLLTDYFHSFRPKSAIKAAYEYADNANKVIEVKDYLHSSYEDVMWSMSKRKVKHTSEENAAEASSKSKKKKSKGKNHRNTITGSENLIISGDKSKILRPKGAKYGVAFRKVIKALRNHV